MSDWIAFGVGAIALLIGYQFAKTWILNFSSTQKALSVAIVTWLRDTASSGMNIELYHAFVSILTEAGVKKKSKERERILHALSMTRTMLTPEEFERARATVRELYVHWD